MQGFEQQRGIRDPDTQRLHDAVRRAFLIIFGSVVAYLLGGRLLKDQALTAATANKVEHGCKRAVYWFVVDVDTQALIMRDTTATDDDSLYLVLIPSLTCVVTLLVFPR